MAYNSYNRSPYFHGSEQDGRSQTSYSDGRGGNGSYQRQPYQPMTSAPTAFVSVQTSSERTTNAFDSARYADLGSTNGGGYNARAENHTNAGVNTYHTNPRSSIDTTALGNLAYASSLGQGPRHQPASNRENLSLQPISDYNTSQAAVTYGESPSYGLASMASNGYDHRRSDSRGIINAKDNTNSRGSPSMHVPQYGGYSAGDGYSNQQAQVYGGLDQGVQSSESHVARFDNGVAMQSARQYPAHPSRPASGQSVHFRQATANSQPTQSPHPPPQAPSHPVANTHQSSKEMTGLDLSKQTPKPSVPPTMLGGPVFKDGATSISKPPTSRPKAKVPRNNPKQAENPEAKLQTGLTNSVPNNNNMTHVTQLQNDQQPAIQPTTNATTNSYHSSQVEQSDVQYPAVQHSNVQRPTTVDPNKIFNHYEYERRQAAAAAAAKDNENTVAETNIVAPVADSPASNTKEQIELEMKQMIEKMRDYKARDPALFSQIWEQVKKGQPSNQTSSQITPSVEPSTVQQASSSENNEHGQLPNLTRNQLPQESDLSVEPLHGPDLGKFPAQRRRTKGDKDFSRRTIKVSKSQKSTLNINKDIPGAVLSLPPAIPLNSTDLKEPSKVVNGSQSMQDAMNSFNSNLTSHGHPNTQPQPTEIVYVRGVGPSSMDTAKSTPESQPARGTIWPESKKKILANAAINGLTSSALNAGKKITSEEIIRLLDQKPSYTDLCETLERRGFIIDRSHFARLLLAAVPGLDSGQAGQENPTTNGGANGISKSTENHEGVAPNKKDIPKSKLGKKPKKSTGFDNVQFSVNPTKFQEKSGSSQFSTGSVQSYALEGRGHPFVNKKQLTQEDFAQSQAPIAVEAPPLPLPPSKKEMARKRSFGELVDLTQDLSEEDDTFRRNLKARLDKEFGSKMPLDSATKDPNSTYDHQASIARSVSPTVAFENDLRKKLLKNLEGTKSGLSSSAATDDEDPDASNFKYPPLLRDLLRSKTIVRRMNRRQDALRRSTYNPKTIARDILVASGRHPNMAPLNFHLNILKKKFRYVEYSSDLSTFRWDLVDPGGPEVGGLGDHDIDMNDADDEDAGHGNLGTEPLSRRSVIASTVNGERIVAPDINIAYPIKTMPPQRNLKMPRRSDIGIQRIVAGVTNDHQMTPQSLVSEEGMMTFSRASDNDTITTTKPLPAIGQIHKSPRGRPPGSGKKFKRNVIAKSSPMQDTNSPMQDTSSSMQVTSSPMQDLPPGQRRRGRPPGSKNKGTPQPSSSGNSTIIPTRPRTSETAAITPSGLRNALTLSESVAVVIGAGSSTVPETSKEQSHKSVSRQPSTPQYKVYKCHWQGCPSKLHNLETLQKHVYKHRDQFPKQPFPCLWANCGTTVISNRDEQTGRQEHFQFENETDWTQHMSGKHIDRYAWELGDGPSAHPSDAEASDYLSDSRGRQVTPAARTSGPPDPMDLTSGRSPTRAYHKAHGNTTKAKKAQAILKAAEARKRATGLGIDRGGSTFVTPKMRDLVDDGPSGISMVAEEDL